MVVERPIRVPVRRRRRWRVPVTMALLVALLVAATWFGWRALRSTPAASVSACTSSGVLAASDVTVTVLNATKRSGLATKTAQVLRGRGFDVAQVSNAEGPAVPGVGLVRGRRAASDELRLLRTQLPKAKVKFDRRADNSVDLVLGKDFVSLAPAPKKTAAPGSC